LKYANRYGDPRSSFYRKGDNIELEDHQGNIHYYKIVDVIDTPAIDLYLGNVAAGTRANPTEGSKTKLKEIEPMEQNILTHAIVGVDEVSGKSCQVRFWRPKEQPQWLSPDGNYHGYIDHKISPVDDPNELFPVFCMMGDTPYFRADNPNAVAIEQWIVITAKRYILEELSEKPSVYAPIPYHPKQGQR